MLPRNRTNADSEHPLFYIWNSIFVRCYYPSHERFEDYGGRGICVTSRWFNFDSFVRDIESALGRRPSRRHSIDRINVNGNYSPGNVRWATPRQQALNTRKQLRRLYK